MKLQETLTQLLVGRSKETPSGWRSINCPACIHNGEPTPDTRNRGGLRINFDGAITYNCLRCHFRAHWRPGISLTKKMQEFLLYLGMDYDAIRFLNFEIWRENQKYESTSVVPKTDIHQYELTFPEVQLPKGSRPIMSLLNEGCQNSDFLDVCDYLLNNRGEIIASSYEYYWSPDKKNHFNRSVIIPFYYNGKKVGYSARRIDKSHKVRYFAHTPHNYLFMNHNLESKSRKYVILVEGVFDTIAIDGVGVLGGSLNNTQINWINNSFKEKIVVPDREKSGQKLVDIALENGWWVSIPTNTDTPLEEEYSAWSWHSDIKDCADAVKRYGRLYTLASILENKSKDVLKIELYKKMFLGG